MMYFTVNRVHPFSPCEEVLRLTVEAENGEKAKEIMLKNGYIEEEILSIDEEFEKIKVIFKEDFIELEK